MILKLISEMADPHSRFTAASALAEHFGCSHLFVLIRDTAIDAVLPAPGFPQTLLIDAAWNDFLLHTSAQSFYRGSLSYPDRAHLLPATGIAGPHDSVVLLLGGRPPAEDLQPLITALPILTALFLEEQKSLVAQNQALFAVKITSKAESLTKTVDSMRLLLKDGLVKQEADKHAIEELLKKKDEFINIASHELKTPVTSLRGYLQLLARDNLDTATKGNFLNKARAQADKISFLINDLLNVSKIQGGQMPLAISEFNLMDLVDDVACQVRLTNPTHQVELTNAGTYTIRADYSRLEQVVSNLLLNAVKYSPGAQKVVVSAARDHASVTVKIRDFGIGIEPEQIPHLFDRFFRASNVIKNYPGLGLGLYISKEIITRHGGVIGATSEPMNGSTFWFTLPCVPTGECA